MHRPEHDAKPLTNIFNLQSSIAIVANTSFLIHAAVLAMLPQTER